MANWLYLLLDGKLIQVRKYIIFSIVSTNTVLQVSCSTGIWENHKIKSIKYKFKVMVKMSSLEAP